MRESGMWPRLGQAFRQNLVFHSWSYFGTDTLASTSVLTQLLFQLLHLIVVQVLLHQVAFPLYTGLHIRWHIWDQPCHKELHHKHNMLRKTKMKISDELNGRSSRQMFCKCKMTEPHAQWNSPTSIIIIKAILAARICQNCMVTWYSFGWPGG